MSDQSDTGQKYINGANKSGNGTFASSEHGIKLINDYNSPNFVQETDNISDDVKATGSLEPLLFKRLQEYETLSSGYQESENKFDEICSSPIGFRTRLDFGTGFNMNTVVKGTELLSQFTTIISEAPLLKGTRIADGPFSLTQRTVLPIHPQISKSPQNVIDSQQYENVSTTPHLSYCTHRWARIQHNSFLEDQKFRNSPKRIKVIPTPIRRLKNIRTYDKSPPPITVSKDRKPHEIFTPESIYKKQLMGKENPFGDDYESPEVPWESGRWHDSDEYDFREQEKLFEKFGDLSLPWDVSDQVEPVATHPQARSTILYNSSGNPEHQYNPTSPLTLNSSHSFSINTSAEELDWRELFSPENAEPPANQRKMLAEKQYIPLPVGRKRYFQPSNGFIPSTL